MLQAAGVHPTLQLGLPDHSFFDSVLNSEYEGYELICTEKDAVKLWPMRPDAWAVPLICRLPEAFLQQLDVRITALSLSRHLAPALCSRTSASA